MEIWDRFKTIIFSVSLDGIDEQFNYIRWPLKWNKVSKNLIRLKRANIHNVLFRVEFTVNWINAFYFDRLERWVEENFSCNLSGDKTEINLHQCFGDWGLDNMPVSIRNKILNKYLNNITVNNFIKKLPPPKSLAQWVNFVNTWDQHRNLYWHDVFPELKELIFEEINKN